MYRFVIIFLIMLTTQLSAVMYTKDEIRVSLSSQTKQSVTQEFIREFFVAKNPQAYIENYINDHKNNAQPIDMEHNLYALLSEVAYHPKQEFLQIFVDQMKDFNVQAMRLHDEGNMPVAIYNVNAKAIGIENIWLADESFNYYQYSFSKNPISTLEDLKNHIQNLQQPQWLGLKNSLKNISQYNQSLLSDYLIQDAQNRAGLDKFVSHYALLTVNENLVRAGLQSLDKRNSEYLLRDLHKHFSDEFVVNQLIDSVNNKRNQKFAISMMGVYLDEPLIQKTLVRFLSDEKLATSAAIVLTQSKQAEVINQLETLYAKSQSAHVKKQILFTLQMNQMHESKTALNRIDKLVESHSKSAQWLNSFKGEIK